MKFQFFNNCYDLVIDDIDNLIEHEENLIWIMLDTKYTCRKNNIKKILNDVYKFREKYIKVIFSEYFTLLRKNNKNLSDINIHNIKSIEIYKTGEIPKFYYTDDEIKNKVSKVVVGDFYASTFAGLIYDDSDFSCIHQLFSYQCSLISITDVNDNKQLYQSQYFLSSKNYSFQFNEILERNQYNIENTLVEYNYMNNNDLYNQLKKYYKYERNEMQNVNI